MKKVVVDFPPSKIVRNINQRLTKEEKDSQEQSILKMELEDIIDDTLEYFFTRCMEFQILRDPNAPITDDRLKQVALSIESLRSLVWDMKGFKHPLQKVSQQMFYLEPEDHSMQLKANTAVML